MTYPGHVKRPPGITPQQQSALMRCLKAGHYIQTACRLSGINTATYENWMAAGGAEEWSGHRLYVPRSDETPKWFADFVDQVHLARAMAEDKALKAWVKGFSHDWRAAAAFLGRSYPKRWGKQREMTDLAVVSGDTGKVHIFIPDNSRGDSDDELGAGTPSLEDSDDA